MPRDLLTELARFDTATICNTIELFEVRSDATGFMDQRIRAAYPELPPMVGYASTATFRSATRPQTGNVYSDLDAQLQHMAQLPGRAIVVFQDLDDPPVGATFGEIMCSSYRAYGATGLITSGGGRDLQPIRKLNFPVFTGSTVCSHGCSHIVDIGTAIRVGGLTVHSGDLLHGDGDGVTAVPLEIASEIPEVAQEFVAAERIILDYAQAPGRKSLAELRERRQAAGEAMAQLRRRVGRAARSAR